MDTHTHTSCHYGPQHWGEVDGHTHTHRRPLWASAVRGGRWTHTHAPAAITGLSVEYLTLSNPCLHLSTSMWCGNGGDWSASGAPLCIPAVSSVEATAPWSKQCLLTVPLSHPTPGQPSFSFGNGRCCSCCIFCSVVAQEKNSSKGIFIFTSNVYCSCKRNYWALPTLRNNLCAKKTKDTDSDSLYASWHDLSFLKP